jgi:hypothetical protein
LYGVDCLDADSVQALLAGGLVGADRTTAEAHLDTCEECRLVVAAMVKQDADDRTSQTLTDPGRVPVPADGLGAMTTLAPPGSTVVSRPARGTPGTGVLGEGATVGRYRVKAMLGAGGMGVVYRAADPQLGRDLALKLLRYDRAGDEEERRLAREGQALAKVSHPNVITVHDVGTHDGRVFVAMELVEGGNLRTWLAAQARPLPDVLAVLAAAGRGLAAAHAAGLVHRDFKPDNVLVGTDGRVRVTDFGLARPERAQGPITSGEISLRGLGPEGSIDAVLTRAGALVGSPAYMAPEQLAGGHVDARSDQFGFCVTLYEALYGMRPFAGTNIFELEENVMAGKVVAAPAGSRVPSALRAIVLRGLAVKPGDRFPSMDHLLAALGRSRARGLRLVAAAAAALAIAAGVGLFADWLARERQLAFGRAGFAAKTEQLDTALESKYEAFRTLADASRGIGMVHEVMSNRDQADFGLGSPDEDRARLSALHDGMVSDEWLALVGKTSGGVLAVSDYKGRLLITTAAPDAWGTDVQVVGAIARAMEPDAVYAGEMLRADDPALVKSGLTGGYARDAWVLLFARQFNAERAVQGLFVQVIDGGTLLAALRVGDDTEKALVAPDGRATETMAPELVAAGLSATGRVAEVELRGRTWSVHASELGSLDDRRANAPPIARVVIASPLFAPGLFASARLGFGIALAAMLALAAAAFLASRRSARLLGGISATADASVPITARRA